MTRPDQLPIGPICDAALSVTLEPLLSKMCDAFERTIADGDDALGEATNAMVDVLLDHVGERKFKAEFRETFSREFRRIKAGAPA